MIYIHTPPFKCLGGKIFLYFYGHHFMLHLFDKKYSRTVIM